VSAGLVPNTSPIRRRRDPHASLFQLTGIKRELLVAQYLRGDVTGQTWDDTDPNIGRTECRAASRTLESICNEHVSCHFSTDPHGQNQGDEVWHEARAIAKRQRVEGGSGAAVNTQRYFCPQPCNRWNSRVNADSMPQVHSRQRLGLIEVSPTRFNQPPGKI
jgi:hypothetical protein